MTVGVEGEPPSDRHLALRVFRVAAVVTSLLLFVTTVGMYGLYLHLNANITHVDDDGTLKKKSGKTVNYLIIGSDDRQVPGAAKYGPGVTSRLADTVILAHLPGNGKSARLVSFPRDGLVTIPSCKQDDGTRSTPHLDKFNASFAIGGAPCVVRTVREMTGLEIDDFIVVSLPGFVRISNALGGVEVCLPNDVADPDSRLYLSAGRHKIKGETALAYVRVRHGLPGSRIRRQQAFLGSAIQEATSSGLLLNPGKLYRLLDVTTKSITTGRLDLHSLARLAERFKKVKPGNVNFFTVPTLPARREVLPGYDNPNGVYVDPIDEAAARRLFEAVTRTGPVPAPTPSADASPELVVPPASVSVRVLNGMGEKGAAGAAAAELAALGFRVVGTGDADSEDYTQTIVRHGSERLESAQTLAAAVPGAVRQEDVGLGSTLELVIGADYEGTQPVDVGPRRPGASPTPDPPTGLSAAADPCDAANDATAGPA